MDVDQIKTLRALNEKTGVPMSELVRWILVEFFQGASGNGRREGGKMKIWRLPFIHRKIQAKAAARYAAVRAEAKAAEAAEADRLAREGRGRANGAA